MNGGHKMISDVLIITVSILGYKDVKDLRDAYITFASRLLWADEFAASRFLWFVYPHPALYNNRSALELRHVNYFADVAAISERGKCTPVLLDYCVSSIDDAFWKSLSSVPSALGSDGIHEHSIVFVLPGTVFIGNPLPIVREAILSTPATSNAVYFFDTMQSTAAFHSNGAQPFAFGEVCVYHFAWIPLPENWNSIHQSIENVTSAQLRHSFCSYLLSMSRATHSIRLPVPKGLKHDFNEALYNHRIVVDMKNTRHRPPDSKHAATSDVAILRNTAAAGFEVDLVVVESDSDPSPGDTGSFRFYCDFTIAGPWDVSHHMDDNTVVERLLNYTQPKNQEYLCSYLYLRDYFIPRMGPDTSWSPAKDSANHANVSGDEHNADRPKIQRNRHMHFIPDEVISTSSASGTSTVYPQPWALKAQTIAAFPQGYTFDHTASQEKESKEQVPPQQQDDSRSKVSAGSQDLLGSINKAPSVCAVTTFAFGSVNYVLDSIEQVRRMRHLSSTAEHTNSSSSSGDRSAAEEESFKWKPDEDGRVGVCSSGDIAFVLYTDVPQLLLRQPIEPFSSQRGHTRDKNLSMNETNPQDQQLIAKVTEALVAIRSGLLDRVVFVADDYSTYDVTDFLRGDYHCNCDSPSIPPRAANCPFTATAKCPLTAANRISSCCRDILYRDQQDGSQGMSAQYHSPVYWQPGEKVQIGRICEEGSDLDSTVKDEFCNSFNNLGVDSNSSPSTTRSPDPNGVDLLHHHQCTSFSSGDIPTDEEIADALQSLGMDTFHHRPSLWLKRMQALVEPAARYLMQLDADVIPCTSDVTYLEKIFDLFKQGRDVDIVTYVDPLESYGGTNRETRYPYPARYLTAEWVDFPERLLGFILFDTGKPIVQSLIQRYIQTYIVQLRDMMLGRYFVRGDLTAFREALFFYRNSIHEHILTVGNDIFCHRPYRYRQGNCKFYHGAGSLKLCPKEQNIGSD